jgi:hypothetical protein
MSLKALGQKGLKDSRPDYWKGEKYLRVGFLSGKRASGIGSHFKVL